MCDPIVGPEVGSHWTLLAVLKAGTYRKVHRDADVTQNVNLYNAMEWRPQSCDLNDIFSGFWSSVFARFNLNNVWILGSDFGLEGRMISRGLGHAKWVLWSSLLLATRMITDMLYMLLLSTTIASQTQCMTMLLRYCCYASNNYILCHLTRILMPISTGYHSGYADIMLSRLTFKPHVYY